MENQLRYGIDYVPKNYKGQRNLIGQRFGTLLVIEMLGNGGKGHYKSLVRCDCGNEFVAMDSRLIAGKKVRCKECSLKLSRRYEKSDKYLLAVWYAMKSRCTDPTNKQYPSYGGRGIKVCEQWLSDFSFFYEWAIENGYVRGLSIDRINNDGDYEPSNCRWASDIVQANNKRNTRHVEYNGRRMAVRDVARLTGINAQTIIYRINKGWSDYDATHITPNLANDMKKGILKGVEVNVDND